MKRLGKKDLGKKKKVVDAQKYTEVVKRSPLGFPKAGATGGGGLAPNFKVKRCIASEKENGKKKRWLRDRTRPSKNPNWERKTLGLWQGKNFGTSWQAKERVGLGGQVLDLTH